MLLEPEGPSSGLLAGRLAALCATPEHRIDLTERTVQAVALEREAITGSVYRRRRSRKKGTGAGAEQQLMEEVAHHLRALLRDVICGHLPPDLTALADELLAQEEAEVAQAEAAEAADQEAAEVQGGQEAPPVLVETS